MATIHARSKEIHSFFTEKSSEVANNEEMTNMKKKWDDTINVISTLASVGNLGSNHIPQEYHLDDVTPTFLQEMVQACEQVIFESLFPGIYVHIGVLESWMHILNADEKHRGPGSPLRLFLTPNIIPLPMLEKGIPDKARMEVFQSSIDVLLKNYNINNINKVDLIFIPIIKSEHVFLFVFDLKNPSVAIIDNMETANQSGDRYSHIPYIMKDVLTNYLLSKDHPSALKISNQTPQSIELPWKTTKNGVDCGIFCMRHMKTYMGGGPKKWNSRLLNESEGQNKQLNQLRFKYLCKILMSNVNFLKEDILALSRKHDEMDEKKKNGQKPLQI
ncbi:hypothetical protein E3N88_35685 [Mikania micrantha]|uniref:Ubiquitin-like protease family profile domain-containing protein n=1 Tax=Mikania micrantha TaxID=192012 RepID=A0A5N6M1M8_9ASTR|nr:hypothetical protein E3N88_35685 [Mikania micrantha]